MAGKPGTGGSGSKISKNARKSGVKPEAFESAQAILAATEGELPPRAPEPAYPRVEEDDDDNDEEEEDPSKWLPASTIKGGQNQVRRKFIMSFKMASLLESGFRQLANDAASEAVVQAEPELVYTRRFEDFIKTVSWDKAKVPQPPPSRPSPLKALEDLPPIPGIRFRATAKGNPKKFRIFLQSESEDIPNPLTSKDRWFNQPYFRLLSLTTYATKTLVDMQRYADILCRILESCPSIHTLVSSDEIGGWNHIKDAAAQLAFPDDVILLREIYIDSVMSNKSVMIKSEFSYYNVETNTNEAQALSIATSAVRLNASIPEIVTPYKAKPIKFPDGLGQDPQSQDPDTTARIQKAADLINYVQMSLHRHHGNYDSMYAMASSIIKSFFPKFSIHKGELHGSPLYVLERRPTGYRIRPSAAMKRLAHPIVQTASLEAAEQSARRRPRFPDIYIPFVVGAGAVLKILDAILNTWRTSGDGREAWGAACYMADAIIAAVKDGDFTNDPFEDADVHACGFCLQFFESVVIKHTPSGIAFCEGCEAAGSVKDDAESRLIRLVRNLQAGEAIKSGRGTSAMSSFSAQEAKDFIKGKANSEGQFVDDYAYGQPLTKVPAEASISAQPLFRPSVDKIFPFVVHEGKTWGHINDNLAITSFVRNSQKHVGLPAVIQITTDHDNGEMDTAESAIRMDGAWLSHRCSREWGFARNFYIKAPREAEYRQMKESWINAVPIPHPANLTQTKINDIVLLAAGNNSVGRKLRPGWTPLELKSIENFVSSLRSKYGILVNDLPRGEDGCFFWLDADQMPKKFNHWTAWCILGARINRAYRWCSRRWRFKENSYRLLCELIIAWLERRAANVRQLKMTIWSGHPTCFAIAKRDHTKGIRTGCIVQIPSDFNKHYKEDLSNTSVESQMQNFARRLTNMPELPLIHGVFKSGQVDAKLYRKVPLAEVERAIRPFFEQSLHPVYKDYVPGSNKLETVDGGLIDLEEYDEDADYSESDSEDDESTTAADAALAESTLTFQFSEEVLGAQEEIDDAGPIAEPTSIPETQAEAGPSTPAAPKSKKTGARKSPPKLKPFPLAPPTTPAPRKPRGTSSRTTAADKISAREISSLEMIATPTTALAAGIFHLGVETPVTSSFAQDNTGGPPQLRRSTRQRENVSYTETPYEGDVAMKDAAESGEESEEEDESDEESHEEETSSKRSRRRRSKKTASPSKRQKR